MTCAVSSGCAVPRLDTPLIGVWLVVYLLMDWATYLYPVGQLAITPWNPPAGLILVSLLLWRWQAVPMTFIGLILAEGAVRGLPAPLPATVAAETLILLSYGLSIAGLTRIGGFDLGLGRLRDVLALLIAAVLGAVGAASSYVGVMVFSQVLPPDQFWEALARYWIGDVIGVMAVAPMVLLALGLPRKRPTRAQVSEALGQGVAILLALMVVFAGDEDSARRSFYLLFLPLVWIGVRFALIGAVFGGVLTQIGLMVGFVWRGHGSASVTESQFLMLALAAATLLLGAAVGERRRIESLLRTRQVEQAQLSRLSMAGEMAAALAHELNQPLMATVAFVRAAQKFLAAGADEKANGALDRAVAESRRAADIVRSLREFIGKERSTPGSVQVAALINDTLALVRAENQAEGVALAVTVEKGIPDLHADGVQVQQVLLNLIRNALDAMEHGAGSGRGVRIDAVRKDGDVVFEVADRGPGISPEVAGRLFSPFTTTKAHGMGLGLTVCRSLIEAQGGHLWLAETGANGTTFRFSLPIGPQ